MSPPRLPVELTDRVIYFCHDDQKTLPNCALTHLSWLPSTRPHLFHAVTSFGKEGSNRAVQLKAIISDRPIAVSQRWPYVLPYIKIVKIAWSPFNGLENGSHLADAIRGFCNSEDLPSPTVHIRLKDIRIGPKGLSASLSQIKDIVTHIQFTNVNLIHANDIRLFLSPLSRLQHLELSSVRLHDRAGHNPPAERSFGVIPLSTLRMSRVSTESTIVSLTKAAASLPYLEDFGITYRGY